MKFDRNEKYEAKIEKYAHDGRGIALINGKTTFIRNALVGETVKFHYQRKYSRYDEGQAIEILTAGPERVKCKCPHTQVCGGCQLQHMDSLAQINLKQEILSEQFKHFGKVEVKQWISPMTGPIWEYRRKARLSVKYLKKTSEVLVGFHEIDGRFVANIQECPILHPNASVLLIPLRELIKQLSCPDQIPQIEVAVSDSQTALIFRHLSPLSEIDHLSLIDFAKKYHLNLYLQPKGIHSIHKLWPDDKVELLTYQLDEHKVQFHFHPSDFTQVNFYINQKLVNLAIQLLDLNNNDNVLDLFCGLGNFSLPIARYSKHVTAVEGSNDMVERGKMNAKFNNINNIDFFMADLNQDLTQYDWAKKSYHKILIDPPRCGAEQFVNKIKFFNPSKIVYISCNPATLARDAGILAQNGYEIDKTGVLDMFPHTKHVESIAVFVPYTVSPQQDSFTIR